MGVPSVLMKLLGSAPSARMEIEKGYRLVSTFRFRTESQGAGWCWGWGRGWGNGTEEDRSNGWRRRRVWGFLINSYTPRDQRNQYRGAEWSAGLPRHFEEPGMVASIPGRSSLRVFNSSRISYSCLPFRNRLYLSTCHLIQNNKTQATAPPPPSPSPRGSRNSWHPSFTDL